MKKEKKAILIYSSWQTLFKGLTDEQAGELIKAICTYQDDSDYMPPSPVVAAMFAMIKERMDADAEAYEETCRRRSESARNAAAARWHADDAERIRPHAEGMRNGAENADAKAKADADAKAESPDGDDDARARATTPATTSARSEGAPETVSVRAVPQTGETVFLGAVFPLIDGSVYRMPAEKAKEWQKLFPDLDFERELNICAAKYGTAPPDERRGAHMIERHIMNWMIRADGDRKKAETLAKSGNSGRKNKFTDVPQRDPVPERRLMAELSARGCLV